MLTTKYILSCHLIAITLNVVRVNHVSGTDTVLLSSRPMDLSTKGFLRWPFMSVHTWGEDPRGTWRLDVVDRVGRHTSQITSRCIPLEDKDSDTC